MSNSIKILKGSPELRKRLPHGGVQMIASKYGVSWQWAYHVISGINEGNQAIVADAIRMAETHDKIKAAL